MMILLLSGAGGWGGDVDTSHASFQEECGSCYDQGIDTHDASSSESSFADASYGHGWHFSQWAGNCVTYHGFCVIVEEEEDLDSLIDAVLVASQMGDAPELARLVSDEPSLMLNVNRMAVQVVSCDAVTVIANVPINDDIVSALLQE